jgi:hypothetical protein
MKAEKFILILFMLLAGLGCGQNLSGTYTGNEQLAFNGVSGGAPGNVTLALVQTSNDDVSGTIQGPYGTGVLQGRYEGTRLGAVKLTFQTSSMVTNTGAIAPTSPIIGPSGPIAPPTCGPYTGTLTINPTGFTGTLNYFQNVNPATVPQGIVMPANYNCPQARTLTLTR